ncbi:MAG TPA: DinB family protein [Gemmatimonadaceae bacterium]|nr:DinB family protein [Gemmatimonadaceae bacterium]
MRATAYAVTVAAAALLPGLAGAQAPAHPVAPEQQANPVATSFRGQLSQMSKNLVAAADDMPADKYSFKPTPAQMSFGDIVVHLAQGNDYLCGTIAGTKAPTRTKVAVTEGKAALVARLRESFQFCETSLANLDDSKLGESLPFFGGRTMSRAGIILVTVGDWADHYSQSAIYMRLNGLLPPTAKKTPATGQ